MPNQTDQNSNQPVAPPIVPVQSDIPPVPPDFQSVTPDTTQPTAPPASPVVPPDSPPVTTTPPKKKFGGGKIIATVLGILLLIGGVGAGMLLTQQKQLIPQQAFTSGGPVEDTCHYISVIPRDTGCPMLGQKPRNKNVNNVSDYITHFTITNITSVKHVIQVNKHSNYCLEPRPDACGDNSVNNYSDITINAGESIDIVIERSSPSGLSCGSYQTDLLIDSIDGDTNCHGRSDPKAPISWGLCQTGSVCGTPPPSVPPSPPPSGNPSPPPSGNPSPPPGAGAQCLNVKAYSVNPHNSTWTLLTGAQLSALKSGNSVSFCVAGSASSGTFDKALFTIVSHVGQLNNGEVLPETKVKRPGSNDFCQNFTIPAGADAISVKAKIHNIPLGWFGEAI